MKRYMIILGLIFQPYIVADTLPTDTNRSIKFKQPNEINDEVNKEFKRIAQSKTILGVQVVEKKAELRDGIEHIALNIEGKEIKYIEIKEIEEIALYLDLTNVKRPVTVICGNYRENIKRTEKTKLIRISVSKIKDDDTLIIQDRKDNIVKRILIRK